jgi:hypothetical protein
VWEPTPSPVALVDGEVRYHWRRWSSSIAGSGWASGSEPSSTGIGSSSRAAGPRAGAITGVRVGPPMPAISAAVSAEAQTNRVWPSSRGSNTPSRMQQSP